MQKLLSMLVVLLTAAIVSAKDIEAVCGEKKMVITMKLPKDMTATYIDKLKQFPDDSCRAEIDNDVATYSLDLTKEFDCGVTKVVHQPTGHVYFYNRIIVERDEKKETILVSCGLNSTLSRVKRQDLPLGFTEPEELEITSEVTGQAPTPILNIGVRQNGQLIDSELNVQPGTPLKMEVYLDSVSSSTYGIMTQYMEVTDTIRQREVIIANGCSVDTYLFENFDTVDGNYLDAKFRAFKFPETNYVLFKGTINVCLEKCRGVRCPNGQLAYGRKKRAVTPVNAKDPNKVYEVTMTTVIKVDYPNGIPLKKDRIEGKSMDSPHVPTDARSVTSRETESQLRYTYFDSNSAPATLLSWLTVLVWTILFW